MNYFATLATYYKYVHSALLIEKKLNVNALSNLHNMIRIFNSLCIRDCSLNIWSINS